MMRVGEGFDVHALVPDRPLILGGVTIPFDKGLLGHSDADVLIHAVIDALLGASGLGDIGTHFPDTDPKYEGVDSRNLLRATLVLIRANGFEICNLDSTIIAQNPKLANYIPQMIKNLMEDLDVEVSLINVKAKTSERLGMVGREECIVATASVLLACKMK